MSAAFDGFSATEKKIESIKVEITKCDETLKNWFLTRRLKAERAVSFKKQLDEDNFSGLNAKQGATFNADKQLWLDIVNKKLEETLPADARLRKADRYLNIFEASTDRTHLCRIPGMTFFQCLKTNSAATEAEREKACVASFSEFDACRNGVKMQQNAAIENALHIQSAEDASARKTFEYRAALATKLQALQGQL